MTKLIIILTFLIILFLFSSIHSSSNGIWTYPEDIRAGVFGADETLSGSDFYAFNNSVYFNREIITQNIAMNGVLVSGEVPWVRLSGHPSIIAGSGLVGGGVLNESRTINLESSYLDGSAHDLRFVNRGGDTMTGNLNMNNNNIQNINQIHASTYCNSDGDECFVIDDFLSGDTPIFSNNLEYGWPDVIECNLQIERYYSNIFSPPREVKLYLHFSHQDITRIRVGGSVFFPEIYESMVYSINSNVRPSFLDGSPVFAFNAANGQILSNPYYGLRYFTPPNSNFIHTPDGSDDGQSFIHSSDCYGRSIQWYINNNQAFYLYNKVPFDDFDPQGQEPVAGGLK